MKYLIYIAIMAVVTYLIRMLPITLFQKEIKNKYFRSFLYYVPYAVLASMTFPAMLSASGNTIASTTACLVGIFFAYKEKSLLSVAIIVSVVCLVMTYILTFI